jgi:hypothetical protein
MDVIIICNGLGNQMSQYALFLMKKKLSSNTRILFDKRSKSIHNGFELNKVFNIQYEISFLNTILFFLFRVLQMKKYRYISQPIIFLLNKIGISIVEENYNYNFNPEYLESNRYKIRFYYGGWHSEKYFSPIKSQISKRFEFKINNQDSIFNNILKSIIESNSVSIHVRRGDYLDPVNSSTFGSVCTIEYFLKAIDKMNSLVPNAYFFVFTNDELWVTQNFPKKNLVIVDINKGFNSWKDMFFISKCKNQINSNSSFSWWGSWLNKNEQKIVITPKYFINKIYFEDIYPENWIKLSDY